MEYRSGTCLDLGFMQGFWLKRDSLRLRWVRGELDKIKKGLGSMGGRGVCCSFGNASCLLKVMDVHFCI